jgi:hypothetical protein
LPLVGDTDHFKFSSNVSGHSSASLCLGYTFNTGAPWHSVLGNLLLLLYQCPGNSLFIPMASIIIYHWLSFLLWKCSCDHFLYVLFSTDCSFPSGRTSLFNATRLCQHLNIFNHDFGSFLLPTCQIKAYW